MSREISNSDDVIDSRDVLARIEELEDERAALVDKLIDFDESDYDSDEERDSARTDMNDDIVDWDVINSNELKALKALAQEGEDCTGEFSYGETLIRESYFEDYCQELVEDIGDLPRDLPSYIVINWEATANNLRHDYSTIDFDGVDYLIRNS